MAGNKSIRSTRNSLFKNSDPIPPCVDLYLKQNVSALQKLVLQLPNSELSKFTEKYSFLQDISNGNASRILHYQQTYFPVFKLLVDKGVPLKTEDHNYLLTALQCPSCFSLYAVEASTIKPQDFTPEEQIACWRNVNNDEVAQALIKKGFNINVKNNRGMTPVLAAILGEYNYTYQRERLLSLLLANGAALPNFKMLITLQQDNIQASKGEVIKKQVTLEEFLKESYPKLLTILQQASSLRNQQVADHMSEISRLSDFEPSTFAIWKPAISIGGWSEVFKVRDRAILGRTLLSAISTSMLFVPVAIMTPAYLPVILPFIAVPYACYKFERYRAIKALDELAIKEFQTIFPPSQVTEYIIYRESVINQLAEKT